MSPATYKACLKSCLLRQTNNQTLPVVYLNIGKKCCVNAARQHGKLPLNATVTSYRLFTPACMSPCYIGVEFAASTLFVGQSPHGVVWCDP